MDTTLIPGNSLYKPGSRWLHWGFWLCLLGVFVALRIDTTPRVYFFGDDHVVLAVVDDMVATGDWQPDWNRAAKTLHVRGEPASPEAARATVPHAHHYNFSSYLILAAALAKLLRLCHIDTPTTVLLHHLSLLWDLCSLALLVHISHRLAHDPASRQPLARTAAIIFCLLPLGVQGAHYLRPDSFLTLLGAATLALALTSARQWRSATAAGAVLGLAAGIKPSQLMLGMFPALAMLHAIVTQYNRQRLPRLAAHGALLILALAAVMLAMFSIGNIAPDDYRNSLLAIYNYYTTPGPLDTLDHYTYLNQLGNIAHYFHATLGAPLLLGGAIGTLSLLHRRQWLPAGLLCMPPAFFLLYFASVPAFFDRSFCPLLVPLAILIAYGINALATAIHLEALPAGAALTLLCSYQPATIDYQLQTNLLRDHHDEARLAFQQQLKLQWPDFWLKQIDRNDMFAGTLPEKPAKKPRIYVGEDFNNPNSRDYFAQLRANGFVQIAEFRGAFAALPNCSLLTVHQAARYVYFIRAEDMPAGLHHTVTAQ